MGYEKRDRRPNPRPCCSSSFKHAVHRIELMDSTVAQRQRDEVRSYLDSLSSIGILDLFVVEVSEIKAHYLNSVEASSNLVKALSFAEANGSSWKFRECFFCRNTSPDLQSHNHHMRRHLPKLPLSQWESISPRRVTPEWVKIITGGGRQWEPIDVPAALETLQQQPQCRRPDHLNGFWPLSDDLERVELLQRIHIMFRMLLNSSILCASHTDYTLRLAMREADKFPSGLKKLGHKQPSLFIRFLGANKLWKILQFLKDLLESCENGRFHRNNLDLDVPVSDKVVDSVYLVGDSTRLVLDTHPFYRPSNCGFTGPFARMVPIHEGRCRPDTEAVVSWLYEGPSVEVSSSIWHQQISARLNQCSAIALLLKEKFKLLSELSCERRNHLNYWNALQTVKCFCLKELKKEENELDTMSQKLEAALAKGREELVEKSDKKNGAMADAISAIYIMVRFASHDQGSIIEDCLDQFDKGRCITAGFYQLDDASIIELAKIDARIMSSVAGIADLQRQLDDASVLDYLTVVVPLVKHFLRLSIEHEAEEFAIKEAEDEAKQRAFLAELENSKDKKNGNSK